ncbi:MAG: hypothetical protein FHK80_16840 [Azoarcus sp. PHD]|nr:MAG: hypothetical protein FHK80_16840 [Azoarcus sp. PHD]
MRRSSYSRRTCRKPCADSSARLACAADFRPAPWLTSISSGKERRPQEPLRAQCALPSCIQNGHDDASHAERPLQQLRTGQRGRGRRSRRTYAATGHRRAAGGSNAQRCRGG